MDSGHQTLEPTYLLVNIKLDGRENGHTKKGLTWKHTHTIRTVCGHVLSVRFAKEKNEHQYPVCGEKRNLMY